MTVLSRNLVTEMSFSSKNWVKLLSVGLEFMNFVTVTSFEVARFLPPVNDSPTSNLADKGFDLSSLGLYSEV